MIKKILRPINIGTLFNVPIIFGTSAILASIFYTYIFYFSFDKLGWSILTKLLVALSFPIIMYSSITAHEYAHILTAKKYGINTRRIDLFVFGGCAVMEGEGQTPKESFWIAFAGPLLSLFLFLAGTLMTTGYFVLNFSGTTPIIELLKFFTFLNFILFVFNMSFIIYPFDGGRILNAIIWKIQGNKRKSLQISNKISEYIVYLLLAVAVLTFFINVPYFGYGITGFIRTLIIAGLGYMMMMASKNGQMPHV